jgi:hypothetical protein
MTKKKEKQSEINFTELSPDGVMQNEENCFEKFVKIKLHSHAL